MQKVILKNIIKAIKKDRDHGVIITEDYVAGTCDMPDYSCEDFEIKDGVIKVFATGDRECHCDGASFAPDKLGKIDLASAYILHDFFYTHLEDMSDKWKMPVSDVRKWADDVLQNAIAQIDKKGTKILSYLYYWPVRLVGGVFHNLARLLMILLIIYFSGCASEVFQLENIEVPYEVIDK